MFGNPFTKITARLKFKTEKELLLYVIENHDEYSKIYLNRARIEWKEQFGYVANIPVYSYDEWLVEYLAKTSDDAEIIRAIFAIIPNVAEAKYAKELVTNPNLPSDLFEELTEFIYRYAHLMANVDYKYISRKYRKYIDEKTYKADEQRRSRRERIARKKLKSLLIAVNASKDVLNGSDIDDVVEKSITSDVHEDVLYFIGKLLP